jgi:hypothetical protein
MRQWQQRVYRDPSIYDDVVVISHALDYLDHTQVMVLVHVAYDVVLPLYEQVCDNNTAHYHYIAILLMMVAVWKEID